MIPRRLKKERRWAFWKCCFVIYISIGVFSLVCLRTTVVRLEYQLSQLEKQKAEFIKEGKLFAAERAKYYSIENIEDKAINQFGMRLPEREKVFFVKRTTEAAPYKVNMNAVSGGDASNPNRASVNSNPLR